MWAAPRIAGRVAKLVLHIEKGKVADLEFERSFTNSSLTACIHIQISLEYVSDRLYDPIDHGWT